jgi:hypothetical protein
VVLFTQQLNEVKKFGKLAQANLNNSKVVINKDYYVATGDLVKDAKSTTAQLFSSFVDTVTYKGSPSGIFRRWI